MSVQKSSNKTHITAGNSNIIFEELPLSIINKDTLANLYMFINNLNLLINIIDINQKMIEDGTKNIENIFKFEFSCKCYEEFANANINTSIINKP